MPVVREAVSLLSSRRTTVLSCRQSGSRPCTQCRLGRRGPLTHSACGLRLVASGTLSHGPRSRFKGTPQMARQRLNTWWALGSRGLSTRQCAALGRVWTYCGTASGQPHSACCRSGAWTGQGKWGAMPYAQGPGAPRTANSALQRRRRSWRRGRTQGPLELTQALCCCTPCSKRPQTRLGELPLSGQRNTRCMSTAVDDIIDFLKRGACHGPRGPWWQLLHAALRYGGSRGVHRPQRVSLLHSFDVSTGMVAGELPQPWPA